MITISIFLLLPSLAFSDLSDPKLNSCSSIEGIGKCEVKCVRQLGPQCLITHINFEGSGLSSGVDLWRARFLTCRKADVDIQIKSLAIEIENSNLQKGKGVVSASVSSTQGNAETISSKSTVVKTGDTEGRLSRIPFDNLLNSGERHMEASLRLLQCGVPDGKNTCTISGKLVAVTNPNIRCEFHDKTLPGAFKEPSLLLSPGLQNSSKPIGQVGQ